MTMLAQTDDGDIAIENNSFSLVTGKAEIRQRLINNLRSFLTEWFLDLTLGVAWFQLIFEKGTSPVVIETEIKDAVLGTTGVLSFDSFTPLDYDPATRSLTIDFQVKTIDGSVTVQETLP